MKLKLTPEEIDRFKDKHSKGFPDECWQWWRQKIKGYGVFKLRGVAYRAHSLAYELYTGKSVPEGQWLKHTCGNTGCVNPSHLVATSSRNARVETKVTTTKRKAV